MGMAANTSGTMIENAVPTDLIIGEYAGWLIPIDWNALWKPCNKW